MASLEHTGRYSLGAICMPVDFARVRAQSVGGLFQWKNTTQVSAPILIAMCSQASSVGGLIATRLLRTGTGSCARFFGNSFCSFVQDFEQPARRLNVCLGKSPFVFAAVRHEQHSNTRRGEACSKNQTTRFAAP